MKVKTQSKKVNKAWLNQHVTDPWVRLAQKEGYRARAAYKLKELDETFHLVHPGQCVVDLGCAPGAWCQYLRRRLGTTTGPDGQPRVRGTVIGLDLLPMEPVDGVRFIQGDFREEATLAALQAALADALGGDAAHRVDLVVSDMAPNLSGVEEVIAAAPGTWFQAYLPGDPQRITALVERAARAGFETLVLTVDIPVSARPSRRSSAPTSRPPTTWSTTGNPSRARKRPYRSASRTCR